jgi:hypothetical protein
MIICNFNIKKILHGSDSLDIPYMFNVMLEKNTDLIHKFSLALIDTRFICEYYKLNLGDRSDNKCTIYDIDPNRSAVYYFNVVNEEQQNKLSHMLDIMPSHHDRLWNIHNMPESQIRYAQYDVLFLKYIYYRMIKMATDKEKTEKDKKDTLELYRYILPQMTSFIYLENNEITSLRETCVQESNPLNNYYAEGNHKIKMINIYNELSTNLVTIAPVMYVDRMIVVNHFKKTLLGIIKRMIYGHVSNYSKMMIKSSQRWNERLGNQFIIDFMKEMKYDRLQLIFTQLDSIIKERVIQYCKKNSI